MSRHTDKLELVETHNIALSIRRLRSGNGGYDEGRWKRALCHAVWIEITNYNDRKRIREALELP